MTTTTGIELDIEVDMSSERPERWPVARVDPAEQSAPVRHLVIFPARVV
jgi:hypothetical protein